MTETLAIAIAQINPTVGDVAGNLALVQGARAEAAKLGADLVVTGELALCGYPPEDLVLKRSFQDRIGYSFAHPDARDPCYSVVQRFKMLDV